MSKTLTLEEAAQQLGLTTEQFKVNLKTHKDFKSVRPLMGGATMHFRAQDIDELGRRLGLGSEPELQLGDAGSDPVVPLSTDENDEQIEIGRDRPSGGSSARLSGKSSKKLKASPSSSPQGQNPLEIDSSDEFIPLTEGGGSGKRKPGDSSTRLKKSPDSDVKVESKPGGGRSSDKKKADDVFELAPDAPRSSKKLSAKKPDSSEFELKLGADSDSEFELTIADEGSDEADIGIAPKDAASKGGKSGVKLSAPADSGISLEKDSDSEFELNLDSRSSGKVTGPKSSGKSKKPATADSDSEFELTLDDSSGEMAAHGSKPSKGKGKGKDAEKDIFETDFDIPALDDESASEAVVLEEGDTDLESSDFDLALDESGVVDESASEVVELEEELDAEKDESASEALAEVDEDEERVVTPSGPPRPARWGPLPALVSSLSLIVMFFVVLMGYEMLHGMWGFRQPTKTTSPITRTIAELFTDKSEMPKD